MHEITLKITIDGLLTEHPPKVEFGGVPNMIARMLLQMSMEHVMSLIKHLEHAWKSGDCTIELRKLSEEGNLNEDTFKEVIRKRVPDLAISMDLLNQFGEDKDAADGDILDVEKFNPNKGDGKQTGVSMDEMNEMIRGWGSASPEVTGNAGADSHDEAPDLSEDLPPKTWPPEGEDLSDLGQGLDTDIPDPDPK